MKKLSCLIIAVIVLFAPVTLYGQNESRGNSPGNVANTGIAAIGDSLSDGCVFYSFPYKGIIREKPDGSASNKISTLYADSINIIGQYLYCRIGDVSNSGDKMLGKGIYRVKNDGSEVIKINNDNPDYMTIVDGWIYYSNLSNLEIYKIKLDGTGKKMLLNYPASDINVSNNWIYFSSGKILYKMKTDGSKLTKLSDLNSRNFHLNVVGDWMYFGAEYPNQGLYKMKTDGSNLKKLSSETVLFINVLGDTIYYGSSGLYVMKSDGTLKKKLLDGLVKIPNICNGWIYYTSSNPADWTPIYKKVKIDGSQNQNVFADEIFKGENAIPCFIDGKKAEFENPAVFKEKTIMVPIEEILPMLGIGYDRNSAQVELDKDNNLVLTSNSTKIIIPYDDAKIIINGKTIDLDTAPYCDPNNYVMYAPAESLAKGLGFHTSIDYTKKALIIESVKK